MDNNEYILSADEQGMLDEMAAAHQAAYNNELNVLLSNIIRFRKLGDGWAYDPSRDKAKLTRQANPTLPPTSAVNGVAHA